MKDKDRSNNTITVECLYAWTNSDTQPGSLGCNLSPSDGNSYIGMVHQPSGNYQEGASQELLNESSGLPEPMQAGIEYQFNIDISDYPN